ncbi:hypothetical protein [Nocardia sp. NBC_00403]|uniref:hypothetical protein n=1 Tax=Nocardia sp. NBC_00403 TaxID=2975990 RepID=UPI002E24C8D1
MSVVPVEPRPLSQLEAAVVAKLLAVDFEGAAQFRTQIPFTQVVATWGADAPSVDLEVAPGSEQAGLIGGELPVRGEVRDERGSYIGEVTLWATDGFLSAIEYGWVTEDRPTSLPDPTLMTVST